MTEQEWLECTDLDAMVGFLGEKATKRKFRLFGCSCCRRIWHLLPNERCTQSVRDAELYADGLIGEEERREASRVAAEAYIRCAAAAETVLPGTWDPLESLAAEHDRTQFESVFAAACEEARHSSFDTCEAWTARQAAQAVYYVTLIEKTLTIHVCTLAGYAVTFFYEADGWKAYCNRRNADEESAQRILFDDIFGNPFRPVMIDPAWLTPTVNSLAHAAYDWRILNSGKLDPDRLAVLADALEDAGCTDPALLTHLRSPGPHVRGCWALDLLLGKS